MSGSAPRGGAQAGAAFLTLCFGVHNHQPAANFQHVFEQAADHAYLPFLEAAARHPDLQFSLHLSGSLLAWLEEHRPAGVDRIGELVEVGRVELMGGGFFEPILPAIPERDAIGQLEMLSERLERRFGRRPLGAWVAERVWEGRLAALLARAGFRYTVLDDQHFLRAGLPRQGLRGYFVTEREGLPLFLFPIDKGLRYLVPFQPVEKILERLRELHAAADALPCVTYADDGEKFGLWPGTRAWVYGGKWLDRFLDALDGASGWLRTSTFADALERFVPAGRVYLPDASYVEMTEWALPAEARSRLEKARERIDAAGLGELAGPFLAGGVWPAFLAKYPEANLMHKKMLWLSEILARRSARGDGSPELERARGLLYRAQSNCAYWHGIFGGLYLGHLRHAVFADLLRAESLVAPVRAAVVERLDFDRDGMEELWIRTPAANVLVAPARGGGIPLLELREEAINLANVISRQPEAYHAEIRAAAQRPASHAEEDAPVTIHPKDEAPATIHANQEIPPALAQELIYDPHPRLSALEHVLPEDATFGDFQGSADPAEQRPLPRYEVRRTRVRGGRVRVSLAREDGLATNREKGPATEREGALAIEKDLVVTAQGAVEVAWTVAGSPVAGWFVCEWSFFFFSGSDPGRRYVLDGEHGPMLGSTLERGRVREVALDDRPMQLTVSLASPRPFRLWAFPLNTVSRGEGGYETTYQGTCLALGWPLAQSARKRRFVVRLSWKRG